MPDALLKPILWFNYPALIACDGRCDKAWGINGRKRVQLSEDPDDYAFLADDELGKAPRQSGIAEGECCKPSDYKDPNRQNKWCARECERGQVITTGEILQLADFSRRRPNLHSRQREMDEAANAPKKARRKK